MRIAKKHNSVAISHVLVIRRGVEATKLEMFSSLYFPPCLKKCSLTVQGCVDISFRELVEA
jgi:hypothetical protein